MKERGFTLVELLVVIAVIGILSNVVLGAVTSAREKGSDAKIKQTIGNMRAEAELFYDDNGSYIDMCDAAPITVALASVDATNGTGSYTCVDGDDVSGRWAIEVQLVASSTEFFCVDNDGESKVYSASTISATGGSEDAVCGS